VARVLRATDEASRFSDETVVQTALFWRWSAFPPELLASVTDAVQLRLVAEESAEYGLPLDHESW